MKITPVINKSHSLDEILYDLINKSEEIYLATAFIDSENVTKLEHCLKKRTLVAA